MKTKNPRNRRSQANAKKKRQIKHAKRRFKERFDIYIDESELQRLSKKIEAGEAKLVGKQSERVSIYEVRVNSRMVHVVYDKRRKTIVTALPPDWREEQGGTA